MNNFGVIMVGKQITESSRGTHRAMVTNPIYEGPLYETLETGLNPCASREINNSVEPPNSLNSSPTLRYVEQPSCATNTPQNHLSSHIPVVEDTSVPVSEDLQQNGSGNLLKLATVSLDLEEEYTIMMSPAANTACSHGHQQSK